jgi:pimeloyl-ACP methyl ester carboxylesterase
MAKWINNMGLMASSYAMSECLVALRDTDLRGDLDKITVPTIIMHGKKDKVCSFDLAEQLHAGIKNSQLVAFQNSGHSMFLEEKQKFNDLLIKFSKPDAIHSE